MAPWMKILRDAAWLTQLGFSAITPPILCVAITYWGVSTYAWPVWSIVIALIAGLGGSAVSFWGFYQFMMRKSTKNASETPPAFNKHM